MSASDRIRLTVDWMTGAHIEDVLVIERASSMLPWSRSDFLEEREGRSISKIVGSVDRFCRKPVVVAFAVYELFKHRVDVLNMAVHPDWRRKGLGAAILHSVMAKQLHKDRRFRVRIDVDESNLGAQLFLRACGFEAATIIPQGSLSGEDCYRFVYRIDPQPTTCPAVAEASCEGL